MKKTGIWIALFFLALALISIFLYFNRKNREIHPEEIIAMASDTFKPDLKGFLSEVEQTVNLLNKEAKDEDVDSLPLDSLNRYFSRIIADSKLLKGIVVFGSNMNYVIIQDNDSWIVTHNTLLDSLVNWKRFDKNLKFEREWTDTYNFFMNQKELNAINIRSLEKGDLVWRAAKSQLPEQRELLFNIFKMKSRGDSDLVALMFRTGDLSSRFYHVLMFESPIVTIRTTQNELVTPIRTRDKNKITAYDSIGKYIGRLFGEWEKSPKPEPHSYASQIGDNVYWTRMDTISPYMGVNAYAITVHEKDLVAAKKKTEEAWLYAAIMFALFGLFASVREKV